LFFVLFVFYLLDFLTQKKAREGKKDEKKKGE